LATALSTALAEKGAGVAAGRGSFVSLSILGTAGKKKVAAGERNGKGMERKKNFRKLKELYLNDIEPYFLYLYPWG
jgi:hypothetical protein